MKNDFRKQFLVNTFFVFLIVTAFISLFLWRSSSNNSQKRELEKNISEMNDDIKFYEEAIKNYTEDEITKEITEANINVSEETKKEKEVIETSLKKVYSDTKTKEEYDSLEDKIKENLGISFSNVLLKISEPTLNQSGEASFPYDEMTDSKIAFGNYDISSQSMECYVLVYWKSPVLDATNTGVKSDSKEARVTGKDFFILDYYLADNTLEVIDYQHTVDSEVASNEEK